MAFVVVQHLSPDFKSVIDELLARRTRIPILQAEEGIEVEPDTVYLLPPRKELTIKGGRLHLRDKDPKQGLSLPIDHFFRSLAVEAGPMARAIVLSGTGSDGSRGLVEVKRLGGVVLAESEDSAKFDGSPSPRRTPAPWITCCGQRKCRRRCVARTRRPVHVRANSKKTP